MKIWLLRPRQDLKEDDNPWEPWYDKVFGFVVRAETEQDARELTNSVDEVGFRFTGDERSLSGDFNPWTDPTYSTCVELTPEGEPEIIIIDNRLA